MKRCIYFIIPVIFSFASAQVSSLGEVIKKTREMYNNGVDRKEIANYVNKNVDNRIYCGNNTEAFSNPFRNLAIHKNRFLYEDYESGSYEDTANVAWTTQLGNCEENSALVYYILKKAGVKEHVRVLRTAKHSFTVWDINSGAYSDDPSTWGENAIVVDPWLGENLSPDEVKTNKWFMNGKDTTPINDETHFLDSEADTWGLISSRHRREQNIEERKRDTSDDEDCFIATAVYGSTLAMQIQVLRTYRDTQLRETIAGRSFIKGYERFGPMLAYYIRHDEDAKAWVRTHIVEPAIGHAQQQLNTTTK
jgi:hypothetical protein